MTPTKLNSRGASSGLVHWLLSTAVVSVLGAVALGPAIGAVPAMADGVEPQFQADRLIVGFDPGVSKADRKEAVGDADVQLIGSLPSINAVVVDVGTPSERSLKIAELQATEGVRYAEPDQKVRATATPTDPMFPQLWGMGKSQVPTAWDKFAGAPVTVAVIDTGIDASHPELDDNLWRNPSEIAGNGLDDDSNGIVDDINGANFSNGASTGKPADGHGHGTHVSGTIAAEAGNGIGVAGVNPQAKIVAVKALTDAGWGYTSDVVRAVSYARSTGARVINASLGGGGYDKAMEDAISKAGSDSKALFVASAGNSSSDNDAKPSYPASYELDNVVSVAATTQTDSLASFSNRGVCSVDIAAPGYQILSTLPGNKYASWSGTSMASPHVAGVASLLSAREPALGFMAIKARLLDSADRVPVLSGTSVTGGRLNAAAALDSTAVTPPAGCPPKPKPVTPTPPKNTQTPAVSGNPIVGETLSAANGNWEGNPTTFEYQWFSCRSSGGQKSCSTIPGATGASYSLPAASVGSCVGVVVTASNASGSQYASSVALGPIREQAAPQPPPRNDPPPPVRELRLSGSDQRRVVRTGKLAVQLASTVPQTTARLTFSVSAGVTAVGAGPARQVTVGTSTQTVETQLSRTVRKKIDRALDRGRTVTVTVRATGSDAGGSFAQPETTSLRIRG